MKRTVGYMVAINEHGGIATNWDGEVHESIRKCRGLRGGAQ